MPAPTVLTLPGHLSLYHEDIFLRDLAPLHMSRRQFRQWLRCLGVPFIEFGPHRYIHPTTFSLALRATLRIGQPDQTTPGSQSRTKLPKPPRPNLSETALASTIMSLLADSRLTAPHIPQATIRKAALTAAQNLIRSGYSSMPSEAQHSRDTDLVTAAISKGLLNDPPTAPTSTAPLATPGHPNA